jgi:sortase A
MLYPVSTLLARLTRLGRPLAFWLAGLRRVSTRQLRLGASVLLACIGLLIATEVVITLVWQEPFSALSAKRAQGALSKKLGEQERTSEALAIGRRRGAVEMAVLARRFERRTAEGEPLGRISIPKIGSKFVFVAGIADGALKKGPGHYPQTVLPGQHGTVAIAGHRTTYLAPFRDLDRMRPGDRLILTMPYGIFTYRTEGSEVVLPSDTSPLRRIGHDRLVLTTCTPLFSAAKRLVVTGKLVSAVPFGVVQLREPRAAVDRRNWRELNYWPAAVNASYPSPPLVHATAGERAKSRFAPVLRAIHR